MNGRLTLNKSEPIDKNKLLPLTLPSMKVTLRSRAVSSVVEHYLDMVGVTGSNPVPRTIGEKSFNK